MTDQRVRVTWLGHGTFLLDPGDGHRLLLDAWLQNNPACPDEWKRRALDGLSAVLLTHGHGDHIHDAVPIAQATSASIVGIVELTGWLALHGAPAERMVEMNKGGTVRVGGVAVTMVHAEHSCGISDGGTYVYGGEPCGYVLHLPGGRRIYFAGDTAVFGDMRIIADLWHPEIAVLPIGGHYTMDPDQAAYACWLLGVKAVVPGHYGTFPLLAGTPAALREALRRRAPGVEVRDMPPGGTVEI